MRVVILGNGWWEEPSRLLNLLRRTDLLVACNGAYRKARRLKLQPQVLIGDLDSLRGLMPKGGLRILRFPEEKDETDGEQALRFALKQKPEAIVWFGALGGRWDHSLANFFLLLQAARQSVPVTLLQGRWTIHLVVKTLLLRGRKGDRVSLVPLREAVRGITLEGFRYPLRNGQLHPARSRGMSNVLLRSPGRIRVRHGSLLVFHESQ